MVRPIFFCVKNVKKKMIKLLYKYKDAVSFRGLGNKMERLYYRWLHKNDGFAVRPACVLEQPINMP